jgi:predicted outer membrane protein
MAALVSGALAFPAFADPVIPSTSQQLDPNLKDHGLQQQQNPNGKRGTMQGQGGMMQGQSASAGITSAGKLQASDAHTLWLLHQIDQQEIAVAQLAESRSQNDKVKDLAKTIRDDHKSLDDDVMSLAKDNDVQFGGEANAQGMGGAGSAGMGNSAGSEPADLPHGGPDNLNAQHGQQTEPQYQGMAQSGQQAQAQAQGGSSTVEEIPNGSGTGGSGMAQGKMGQMGNLPKHDQQMMRGHQRELQRLSSLQGDQFDRAFVRTQVRSHQRTLAMLSRISAKNDDVKDLLEKAQSKIKDHQKSARELWQSMSAVGGSGSAGQDSSSSDDAVKSNGSSSTDQGAKQQTPASPEQGAQNDNTGGM